MVDQQAIDQQAMENTKFKSSPAKAAKKKKAVKKISSNYIFRDSGVIRWSSREFSAKKIKYYKSTFTTSTRLKLEAGDKKLFIETIKPGTCVKITPKSYAEMGFVLEAVNCQSLA